MRVLVTSQGPDANAHADDRFGRAPFFAIFVDEDEPHIIKNPGCNADHGAAVAAVKTLTQQDVDVVLTGHLGPNASLALKQAGIDAYCLDSSFTIKDAYKAFLNDKLEPLQLSR